MEKRYIVSVVYQKPFIREDKNIGVTVVSSNLEFDKKKQAKELFDKINRTGMIVLQNYSGEVSFSVISVEMMDTVLFKELVDKMEEEQKLADLQDENKTEENMEEVEVKE